MTTQQSKLPHALMWVAGIAIILFCGVGIGAIMGWIPSTNAKPGDGPSVAQTEKSQAAAVAKVKKPAMAVPVPVAKAIERTEAGPTKCTDCGIIESTQAAETNGEGTGIGAVGGAVLGGLLGNQVGKGHGREIATVVGAVGGVMAGNEIEKRARSTVNYEVTVRMDDGSRRVIHETAAPTWRAGDRIRIVDGAIRSV